MDETLHAAVAALMRTVAAETIMPRFRNLADDEIEEKAPDDLVTVVDRESEARLTDGLMTIDPGTSIVGEEACAADPSLLDGVGIGRHWLVDPIDGTGNFAAGRTPFGVMVALVEDGDPVAGWMLDPTTDRLCHAARGAGAFVGRDRIVSHGTGRPLPLAALATNYMSEDAGARLRHRAAGIYEEASIPRCAAEQYPRLGLGINDVAIFQRTLPWDHAAGTLWLNEAGGMVRRPDGSRYRIGDDRAGLLGAATPSLWDAAARHFYG